MRNAIDDASARLEDMYKSSGKHIILGSASPRRRELLQGLCIGFEVDKRNNFEEDFEPGTPLHQIPALLSQGKSHGFHRPLNENEILITADTIVICDDEVMGKPRNREDAVRMLQKLSGRTHEVVTGVTIRNIFKEETFSDTCQVHFAELSECEIDFYIDNFKPYDKAGAYGIQEWIGLAA
ncbi:MAG: Maf family protein, partial [Candidatus Cryptobacteroides sp.]